MKYLLLLVFASTYVSSVGQNFHLRESITQKVKQIDNGNKQSVGFFTSPHNRFTYKKANGKFIKFVHQFKKGNAKTEKVFYINNGALIYSTDIEILYFGKDSSSWRGTYYFADGKLKDYETLGHGRSELDNWEPEREVTGNYKKVKNVVLAYIKQKGEPK